MTAVNVPENHKNVIKKLSQFCVEFAEPFAGTDAAGNLYQASSSARVSATATSQIAAIAASSCATAPP